jgi:hypothetical protein
MITPLQAAEVVITLILTVIFDPKKLHISVKCFIIAGLSFLVAYGGFESEMGKAQLAILLVVYTLICYFVALIVGVRYQRSRTDRMWILLAAVIGIGLFAVYVKYYYQPIASVTDYYQEMQGKEAPAEEQTGDEEYLHRIKEEYLEGPARRGRGGSNRRPGKEGSDRIEL